MRPKQIRTIDSDGNTIPNGRAIVSDQNGAMWSRGRLLLPIIADGRLSISSGDSTPGPGTSTVLYYTPHSGAIISLYDPLLGWQYRDFQPELEFDISSDVDSNGDPIPANGIFDVFVFDSGTELKLELAPWTNLGGVLWADTRVTALTKLDGVYVKSTNFVKRYVGTITVSTSLISFNDVVKGIWNAHNQIMLGVFNLVTTTLGISTGTSNGPNVALTLGLPTKIRAEAYSCGFNSSGNPAGDNNNMSMDIRIDQSFSTDCISTGRQRLSPNVPDPVATANFSGFRNIAIYSSILDPGHRLVEHRVNASVADGNIVLAGSTGGEASRGTLANWLG